MKPIHVAQEVKVFRSTQPITLSFQMIPLSGIGNGDDFDSEPKRLTGDLFLFIDRVSTLTRLVFVAEESAESNLVDPEYSLLLPESASLYGGADSSDCESDSDDSDHYEPLGFLNHYLLTTQLKGRQEFRTFSYDTDFNAGDFSLPRGMGLRCTISFSDSLDWENFKSNIPKKVTPPNISLRYLVSAGLLHPDKDKLLVLYDHQEFRGSVISSGLIVSDNHETFQTPSGFALAVKRTVNPSLSADNGWMSIQVLHDECCPEQAGTVRLFLLRERYWTQFRFKEIRALFERTPRSYLRPRRSKGNNLTLNLPREEEEMESVDKVARWLDDFFLSPPPE